MIQTKIIKECTTKRTVLVSVAIFKMFDSYRSFEKYENNLDKLIKFIPKYCNLRIYVDDSTKYLSEKYNQPFVEFVYFVCPSFQTKDKKFHDGTFGSIVRFLPCFHFPKEYKYICVSDIDINPFINFQSSFFEELDDADISYHSILSYNKPWINIQYPIVNLRFITKIEFPIRILNNFLNDILNKKYEKERIKIIEYNTHLNKYFDINSKFPYGFDELFTNGPLADFIFKKYKILIYRLITFSVAAKSCYFSLGVNNHKFKGLINQYWDKYEKFIWNQQIISDKLINTNLIISKKIKKILSNCPKINDAFDDLLDAINKRIKNTAFHVILHYPSISENITISNFNFKKTTKNMKLLYKNKTRKSFRLSRDSNKRLE